MTVKDVIEELQSWLELGYGEKPVYWRNLNTQEREEVETVDIISDGSGIEIR